MRRSLLPALLLLSCRSEPPPAPATSQPDPPSSLAAVAPTTPAPTPPVDAPIAVDLAELLKDYKANEVRADARWKGKLIRTSGVVTQVGKTPMGDAFVAVGTGAQLELPVVQCSVDPTSPEVLAVSAKSKAVVQGRVKQLLGNVLLGDCKVNPIAALCRSMKEALGAKRCMEGPNGDASGIIITEDAKGAGEIGALFCQGASESGEMTPIETYRWMVSKTIERTPDGFVYGSERGLCYGVFQVAGRGKPSAVPEDRRTAIRAFFDKM